jgi:hypothetical protein
MLPRCFMINDHTIRQLAHQIWVSEGKPEGQSERHWAQAAMQIDQKKEQNKKNKTNSGHPSEAVNSTEPPQPDQT